MTIRENTPDLLFSPSWNWYAAIRMDPVATVHDLDDPIATAAAQAMAPKTYLVYITGTLEFPWPGKPWYPYTVSVLGPSLRAEHPEKGITSDMCIPVFPNCTHPTGREPIRPLTPFPYANCYHWYETEMDIRVLARPEQFDLNRAIRLSPGEQVRMGDFWVEDSCRIAGVDLACNSGDALEAVNLTPPPTLAYDLAPAQEVEVCCSSGVRTDDIPVHQRSSRSSSFPLSDSCSTRSTIYTHRDTDSVEAILQIFGAPARDLTVLPLFDLWENIGEHLKENDIPDPAELFRERDEIVRIVQEARVRAYAALTAHSPLPAGDVATRMTAPHGSEQVNRGGSSVHHTRRFHPRKILQKLRLRLQAFAVYASSRPLRRPYVLIWP